MARAKGYADWSPNKKTLTVLSAVVKILQEYKEYLPMTARQIFYRLVGSYGYPKTERAYKNLCNHLVRARRAKMIPFGVIRDDGMIERDPFDFAGPTEFWNYVHERAENYQRERQWGQDQHIEVWCEAGGMVPQLTRVTFPWGISVKSAGGFLSVTAMHETAEAIAEREVPTVLLHIGDFDPSGDSIFQVIEEDIGSFVMGMGCDFMQFNPRRLAVLPEQIGEYGLETAPPKLSDSRTPKWELENMEDTAQAEAFPPDVLANLLKEAIEGYFDFDILERVESQESMETVNLTRVTSGVQDDHWWLDSYEDQLDDADWEPDDDINLDDIG